MEGGGGRIRVRGLGYHAPTPQAGRVRAWAGGKVVPCPHATWIWRGQTNIMGLICKEKGNFYKDYEAVKQLQ